MHHIVDLSAPQGGSINDGIDSELSSLSIDHLDALVMSEGRGSLLVKADIKEAYRMIPVHPEDQHLLGVQWEGTVYNDQVHCTSLWITFSTKIFSIVADVIQWILHKKGINKGLRY